SGNVATVTRNVKVYNGFLPRITLKGDYSLSICPNSVYHDEGYTLVDFDSSIYWINTATNLNRNNGHYVPGDYFFRYSIRLLQGNKGIDSATRFIKVLDSMT